MVAKTPSYEECRRIRVEENKKRMEALNLHQLSQSLKPKPSPTKQSKPRVVETQVIVVRRSNRFLDKPAPVYKEVSIDRVVFPRTRRSNKLRRDPSSLVYASDEAREQSFRKGEELESSLGSSHPTLVRPMLPSHVSGGFWLGLPVTFCKKYLPRSDCEVTLVDEEGVEFSVVYLARKNGLSGGWKGFAESHELEDGDTVVFELIQRTTLKVYIIRVNSTTQGIKDL